MNNICFIDNFHRSQIFQSVTKNLKKKNNIFWITTNFFFYENNKNNFEGKILYLNKKTNPKRINFVREQKINEIFYSDRILKQNFSMYKYLETFETNIYYFLKKNNINVIIGEFTWAHELLTFRITKNNKDLNCRYYNIQPLRVPYTLSGFFYLEDQSELKKVGLNNKKNFKLNNQSYKKVVSKKTNYNIFNNFLKIFKKNFFGKDDIYYESKYRKIIKNIHLSINRIKYKILIPKLKYIPKLKKGNKLVLFALQKQPEAGVDVKSRYYENSEQLIENIYKTLPKNYILLIKEHKAAIGFREIQFYKKFRNLKNLFYLHENVDISKNIKSFEIVITQAGTIAYEAAVKGITSFTFAKCFFNKIKYCHHINYEMLKECKNINELKKKLNKKKKLDVSEFKSFLKNRSFEGVVSDTKTDPDIMNKKNIQAISKIFEQLFFR